MDFAVADGSKRVEIPTMPVECSRCRETKIVPWVGSVGDKSRASGYSPVLTNDSAVLWLCPRCVLALRPHIRAIVDAVRGKHIHWPHMAALLKDKPDEA